MEYYKNLSLEDLFYINDDGLICCEEWKDIPNYVGKYQVSCIGRVKSFHFGNIIILKQNITNSGCLQLGLSKKGVDTKFLVHRLVATAFIPNPLNLPEVNHIGLYKDGRQGNRLDNRFFSLLWATSSENVQHAYDNGLMIAKKGIKNGMCKITEGKVLALRRIYDFKKTINISKAAKKLNLSRASIKRIIYRESWTHI